MKNTEEKEGFFSLTNGQELYYWSLRPTHPHGVIVVVHGLGEHCRRYQHFAQAMAQAGWAVYLYDQRGHGKTPGPRSYVDSFEDLVQDLHRFVRWIQSQEKNLKIFLLAHSFGGQVGVNYLVQYPREVQGALLSSPNLRLAMQLSWLKRVLGSWFSLILPFFKLPNDVNPSWISRDPKVVKAYQKDPLVQNKVTLRLGSEILKNLDQVQALAPKIKTPCFLFHGSGDKVTCPQGTEEFFENMKIKDRELKIYPKLFHETLNEKGKEQVYQDIGNWLEEHRS